MTQRALIVIDVQESFRARPSWALFDNTDIADDVNRLVDHARANGDLVVWVLHEEPGTGTTFDPESGHVRYLEGLREPAAGDVEVRKTAHNAFTTTNLQQRLTERGVTDVAISGIRTEQCCETTARLASDLGYRVRLVLDATATQPLPRHDGRGRFSAAEVQDRTAAALQGRFAEVVNLEEVLAGSVPVAAS
jgi:nicotinamidase-related amidase